MNRLWQFDSYISEQIDKLPAGTFLKWIVSYVYVAPFVIAVACAGLSVVVLAGSFLFWTWPSLSVWLWLFRLAVGIGFGFTLAWLFSREEDGGWDKWNT